MSWLSKQLNSFGLGAINQVMHPVNDVFKGASAFTDKYAHMWHVGGKNDWFTPALEGVGGLLAGGSSLWGSSALGAAGAGAGEAPATTYGSLGALGGNSGGLGTYGSFGAGSGAGAGAGGLGAGATETYSPSMIEATSGSSAPSWVKFAQAGMNAGGQQNQQAQMRFEDPAIDAERRRQRVLELLVQLHQSQQAPQ